MQAQSSSQTFFSSGYLSNHVTASVIWTNTSVAFVKTNGNNATAVVGQEAFPFFTVNAAIASLPNGGKVKLDIGQFAGFNCTSNNIWIEGTQIPQVVYNGTGYPVDLTNGSIILSNVRPKAEGFRMSNLGINGSSNVINSYFAGAFNDPVSAQLTNSRLENLVILAANSGLSHNCLVGGSNIFIGNTVSLLGYHGVALKIVEGTVENIYSAGHGHSGVLLKSDTGEPCSNVAIRNVTVRPIVAGDTGFGIMVEANDGLLITNFSISNVDAKGMLSSGIRLYTVTGQAGITNGISGGNITNCLLDGNQFGVLGQGAVTDISVTSTYCNSNSQYGFICFPVTEGSPDDWRFSDCEARGNVIDGFYFETTSSNNCEWSQCTASLNGNYGFRNPNGIGHTFGYGLTGFGNVAGLFNNISLASIIPLPRFILSATTIPSTAGTIHPNFEQPANSYESGTVVTLTANASGASKFYGWSGSANGTSNQHTLKMDGNKTITAFFTDSSLVWQHNNGTLATWFTDGTNLLGSTFLHNGAALPAGWKLVAAHDFNADGSKDLLFQHNSGQLGVWFMDGNSLKSSLAIGNATANWRVAGVSYFNEDGNGDILFQHVDGRLAVWFMDGITYKSSVLLHGGKTVGTAWKIVGVKDFDADGKADILFQHTNGQLAVWLMNRTNLISSSVLPLNPGPVWRVVGLGNFNSDSKPDFVFQHTGGTVAAWFMDGTNFLGSTYLNNGQPVVGWKIGTVK